MQKPAGNRVKTLHGFILRIGAPLSCQSFAKESLTFLQATVENTVREAIATRMDQPLPYRLLKEILQDYQSANARCLRTSRVYPARRAIRALVPPYLDRRSRRGHLPADAR